MSLGAPVLLPGPWPAGRLAGMNEHADHCPAPSFQVLDAWNGALAHAFASVDEASFLEHLACALSALTPIESMMISLERQGQAPHLLYQQGIPRPHYEEIINRYFSRGYLLDPFCLAVDKGLAEGFYHLAQIAPDDFFNSEYYKTYYLRSGGAQESYYTSTCAPTARFRCACSRG